MTEWSIEGIEFNNCNCIHGCPCQFEGLPTDGHCRGFEVLQIERGHYGDIALDGLRAALIYAWPGPIFEGKGEMQIVIDQHADPRQRVALERIFLGEDTDEGATHWWVYRAMSETVHPTLFCAIDYEVDVDARKAKVSIPGLLESVGTPIKSPATGGEHRVRIDIPDGIEFELAEIGNASTTATGAIRLDLKNSYGQFNRLRHSGRGVTHGAGAAA